MSDEKKVKSVVVFCAKEQKETAHVLDIDGNGEIVLTCECGSFIKLPRGTDAEGLKAYVATHKAANEGQISVEALEAEKEKLFAGLE